MSCDALGKKQNAKPFVGAPNHLASSRRQTRQSKLENRRERISPLHLKTGAGHRQITHGAREMCFFSENDGSRFKRSSARVFSLVGHWRLDQANSALY